MPIGGHRGKTPGSYPAPPRDLEGKKNMQNPPESNVSFHPVRNMDKLKCAQIYYGTPLADSVLGKIGDPALESFHARRKNNICREMVPIRY